MKDYSEVSELVHMIIGDEVVGFFERRRTTAEGEVRVFTPVYARIGKSKDFRN